MDAGEPLRRAGWVLVGLLCLFLGIVATGLGLVLLSLCTPEGGLQCRGTNIAPAATFFLISAGPLLVAGVVLVLLGKAAGTDGRGPDFKTDDGTPEPDV